jgi:glutamate--cysteine ligase
MTVVTVPHLKIAATGPLHALEKNILTNQIKIESWFRGQWQKTPPPFYCSVDLRNSGYKLAPIDTNLFPAGFNNINEEFLPLCIQATQEILERLLPGCQRILLIPENHSRNLFYLENVVVIRNILQKAGYEVELGRLPGENSGLSKVELPSGKIVQFKELYRKNNRVYTHDFSPCLILLNHDLSEGIPDTLKDIEQMIMPALKLGWANRLKSQHFSFYETICQEFANLIDIDPWWLNPLFRRCDEINFMERGGEQCLEKHVSELFEEIKVKYKEYGIEEKPFIVIKADAGTYGMGIMMVHDPKEVYELNRKQRKKMMVSKGGKKINKVIIQEGVYSFETIGKDVAEPVIYMIGKNVIGGFYRVHKGKTTNENLNAPGMHFESLAFADSCNMPDPLQQNECCPNRFYTYGVVARLALLAAARENRAIA